MDSSDKCGLVRPEDGLCEKCKEGSFMSGYQCVLNRFKDSTCLIQIN